LCLLVSSNEIANIFTIIAKVTAFNLSFHPVILLLSQRDGFPVHTHIRVSSQERSMTISYCLPARRINTYALSLLKVAHPVRQLPLFLLGVYEWHRRPPNGNGTSSITLRTNSFKL